MSDLAFLTFTALLPVATVLSLVVRAGTKPQKGYPLFDGASWKAAYFVYRDKAALVRRLRELGVTAPENLPDIREMPADLRTYRRDRVVALTTSLRIAA